MYDSSVFVLYPRNRAFLEGKKRYPPARVQLLSISLLLLSFPFIFLFALLMVYLGSQTISEYQQIEQNGISTQGWVRNINKSTNKDSWLCYYFYDNNQRYQSCSLIKKEIIPNYSVGTQIEILYVSSNPHISRFIEGQTQLESMIILMIISASSSIYFAFMIIVLYKAISKNRRLRNKGIIVKGEIDLIHGHRSIFTQFFDYLITITVSFRTPETYEIISKKRRYICNHLQQKPLPPIKTPIYILYVDEKLWEVL